MEISEIQYFTFSHSLFFWTLEKIEPDDGGYEQSRERGKVARVWKPEPQEATKEEIWRNEKW